MKLLVLTISSLILLVSCHLFLRICIQPFQIKCKWKNKTICHSPYGEYGRKEEEVKKLLKSRREIAMIE